MQTAVSENELEIIVRGADNLEVEIWAARRKCLVLAEAIERQVKIQKASMLKP